MGAALWLAGGVAAFLLARIIPTGRRRPWLGELLVSVFVALALGVVATALDFGGWAEPDWRVGLFTFLGSLAGAGAFRSSTMTRSPGGPS